MLGVLGAGCNSLTKLDAYSVAPSSTLSDTQTRACRTNAKCTDEATAAAGSDDPVPAVCVKQHRALRGAPERRLRHDHRRLPRATTPSSSARSSRPRARRRRPTSSASRAHSSRSTQINDVGGMPLGSSTVPKKLVLVSCDESTNLLRAGNHLVARAQGAGHRRARTPARTRSICRASLTMPGGHRRDVARPPSRRASPPSSTTTSPG